METGDFVKRVVIEFRDGHIQDIADSYTINQISGILTLVNESEQLEILKLLNEMEVDHMIL